MTIRQEAYRKLTLLSDSGIRIVLPMLDEMLHQGMTTGQSETRSSAEEKRLAFEQLLQSREKYPFPTDFNAEEAFEEAMKEKYGNIM